MNLPLALVLATAVFILLAFLAVVELLRRRRMLPVFTVRKLNATTDRVGHGIVAGSPDHSPVQKDCVIMATPRRFTWPEVQSSTANFSSAVIGKGGFSTVYAAQLQDSTVAAVKLHNSSERLHRAFLTELDVLLHVHHPNIVRLIGFCDEQEDQGALLFEYVPNGNLHEILHGDGDGDVLPWARRTFIAYQLAQALHYLHEGCELQIVHGDIKSSNVLLDEDLNPLLCDFGCSRMGFSALVRPPPEMTGSPGYIDPHYIRTGMVSKKSDVYSFGVLLLELITGAEAFNAETERLLTTAANGILRESAGLRIGEFADRRLAGEYDEAEMAVMASISAICIRENPSLRPTMADVTRSIEEKVLSSISTVDCKK